MTTLVCSIAIIASAVIYLLIDIMNPVSKIGVFDIKVLIEESTQTETGYAVPVEIKNVKGNGVAELWFEIESENYPRQKIKLEYLGRGSKQKLNIFLNEDPVGQHFKVKPIYFSSTD